MFGYKIEANENNQWSNITGWVRPFTDGQTLDDSLDSGKVMLSCVTRSAPYAPFTRIRISIYEEGIQDAVDVLQYVVDTDTVTTRRFAPSTALLYDHEIGLVELTKLLEREICDTMTVTNYLGHDYADGEFRTVLPVVAPDSDVDINQQTQVTPALKDPFSASVLPKTIQVPIYVIKGKVGLQVHDRWFNARIYITSPSGNVTMFPENGGVYDGDSEFNTSNFPNLSYTLTETGSYKIEIQYGYEQTSVTWNPQIHVTYMVSVFEQIPSYKDWTITDVVNRLLEAGVTRRIGLDTQKYVFDSTQAQKYANVLAPEFAFTRGTLFEALLTVGGYIHGIPRLIDNNGTLTVKFDLLGQDNAYSGNLPLHIYERSSWSGNEYCGALDSTVENLLNTTDRTQGAVTEPSADTFRAVNTTEGGFRISANDGLVILTDKPIYQVTKLEFYLNLNDGNPRTVDITPYVYESAEYQTLSGYTGQTYPYSKGWALEYTQGQKNIRGLDFVLNAPQGVGTFDKQYAIVNILEAATGLDASDFTLTDLQFRVTYIPYVTSRIVQRKPYLTHPIDNVLLYNQGGNSVENEYYGERLKGTIVRIGNITSRRTYNFVHYADIPQAGQKIGNRYVALVDREFDRMRIKATVTTVANFNKLAEYLGLNSNYRLYDVSEKQSASRMVNYGESCVISESLINNNPRTTLITVDGIGAFQKEFNASYPGKYEKVTAMRMVAKSGRVIGEGTEISPAVGMAAGSFASGNSLVFFVNMQDNYGAGYQSNEVTNTSIRAQRLMPYSDELGNISTVDIDFVNELEQTDSSPTPQSAFDYPAYEATGAIGTIYFSTRAINEDDTGGALGISKDSREALGIVVQQHFQSDNQNIVIGKALTKYCPLVSTQGSANFGKLYFLAQQLNPLEGVIDLTGVTASDNAFTTSDETVDGATITDGRAFRLVLPANDSGQTAKAWAIINPSTGELYLGQNYPDGLAAGATPASLYFNFLNNAELKQYMIDEYTLGTAE